MAKKYDVAAFIWPAYTGDEPRTRVFWPEGMGEWQSVRSAQPKFPGHKAQRVPLWGYVNEANPDVMEMEIACAARHGVNVFIYDWYWYDGRPFLENCLDDGYLKATNNDLVKFYLMWANHDATNLWNKELADDFGNVVTWRGNVGMDTFRTLVDRWINKYFTHPSYYKINGCPVFMIYDLRKFEEGFGGTSGAVEAVAYFRKAVQDAGFPDLHLQLVTYGPPSWATYAYKGMDAASDELPLYKKLGVDSLTHYQWQSMLEGEEDYEKDLALIEAENARMDALPDTTFFPHVTLGWDNNTRFKKFRPFVIHNNTPENVEKALRMAKAYVDTHDLPAPLITINSWNEWTEGSYLQPDNLYGYGYLEAVKRVFCDENE